MPDFLPIVPRPQIPQSPQGPALEVLARPPQGGGALPTGDSSLAQLLDGLSSFNPLLKQVQQKQTSQDEQAAIDQGRAAAEAANAPKDALSGAPVERPSTIPPAYDAEFRRSYGQALAQRAALGTKADISQAYETQKNTPGFDLNTFLQQQRAQALQGVTDPLMVGTLGGHLDDAEAAIRSDYASLSVQKVEQNRMATAYQLADGFTGEKSPEELGQQYLSWYLPQVNGMQVDKKQAASLFLQRLTAMSDAGGGRPELFDAMGTKDTDGLSILARNPQLQPAVLEAKKAATEMRDRKLHQDTEQARFSQLAALHQDVMERPETITLDRLQSAVGPNGLDPGEAASIYHEALISRAKLAIAANVDQHAKAGQLGLFDDDVQKKYLEQSFGPTTQALWDAATNGQSEQVSALGAQLMQAQSHFGATVPVESLKRLIQTNVSSLPNPQGPSASFEASAAIYRALAANQQYRDLYFPDAVGKVMDAYVRKADSGVDAKTAYDNAYRQLDPDVLAANRKRMDTPDMQSKVSSLVTKAVDGSSWIPRWLGGNGRPTNAASLGVWATQVVRDQLASDPDMTDSDLWDAVKTQAARNWVMDTTSNEAVQVPPGLQGANLQQAISDYSQDLKAGMLKKGHATDNTVVRYRPRNTDGLYRVQLWDGAKTTDVGEVTAQQLAARYRAKKTMTPEEGSAVVAFKQALANGTEVPDLAPDVLGKAISSGFLKDSELQQLQVVNAQRLQDRLAQVPNMGFGQPTGDYTEVPRRGTAVVDNQLTAGIASELFGSGTPSSPFFPAVNDPTTAAAASLIAMREGVSLRPYHDPSSGTDIGAGYSLTAHAAEANSDLKRAGVPVDRIEDVKAGKAQLTPDQAKRLLLVALPRYATATQKVADATAPGLWDRMLPSQRAVMIDLAYQTGDAGQFRNAWAALQRGDVKGFTNEARSTYVNQAGQRVEDTRATDLRASLLAGGAYWRARMGIAAGRPSNAIQAASLAASEVAAQ